MTHGPFSTYSGTPSNLQSPAQILKAVHNYALVADSIKRLILCSFSLHCLLGGNAALSGTR